MWSYLTHEGSFDGITLIPLPWVQTGLQDRGLVCLVVVSTVVLVSLTIVTQPTDLERQDCAIVIHEISWGHFGNIININYSLKQDVMPTYFIAA